MHDHDRDKEWIADLDWSNYRRPHTDFVSQGRFFLPVVVDMLARQVCAPYPKELEFFLGNASNPPPTPMVWEKDAFTEDGTAVHAVHERLGSTMRSYADEFSIALDDLDAVDRKAWAMICRRVEDQWNFGIGARRAVDGLAPIIARLAADERIACHAHPINGGGETVPISGYPWWTLQPRQAVRRIASGALNLTAPFDPNADPDHLIFVDTHGLQDAIVEAQRTNYVAIALLELGRWAIRRPADHHAVKVAEVTAFLIELMDSGRYETATTKDFEYEVEIKFGTDGLGRCYEHAKKAAIADPSRARFGKRRPRA